MKENNISIIIPTLNEAINIKHLLLHLLQNSATINISEIIIVDCGSTDDTQKIVVEFALINHKLN
jgi:glycosyltransferase involved in cell wall biosynthesis